MVLLKDVKKSFQDLQVLTGINFGMTEGRIYGLAGKSGAGKSTLLRCINGLEQYDSGSLTVDGVEVNELTKENLRIFRKNIGMIFQHFSLLERLSVYENVALPMRCWKYKSSAIDLRVRDLLDVVGIGDKINSKPKELSGGQKQRVAIARALTMNPKILLCDEATSALDPNTSKSIVALLKKINKQFGITIVFVTHQMPVIRSLCDEIAILEKGKIVDSGVVEDVFQNRSRALLNLTGEDDLYDYHQMNKVCIAISSDNSVPLDFSAMAQALDIDITVPCNGGFENKIGKSGSTIKIPERDIPNALRYISDQGLKCEVLSETEDLYPSQGNRIIDQPYLKSAEII